MAPSRGLGGRMVLSGEQAGWLAVEWGGAALALAGSAVVAGKRWETSTGYKLWIVSRLFYVALFALRTHQYGMLTMQVVGVGIEALGLWQWLKGSDALGRFDAGARRGLFAMAALSMAAALAAFAALAWSPGMRELEWAGSALGTAGTFWLASRHRSAGWAFPVWAASNALLALLTWLTGQWGVFALQCGFFAINLHGCRAWLRK